MNPFLPIILGLLQQFGSAQVAGSNQTQPPAAPQPPTVGSLDLASIASIIDLLFRAQSAQQLVQQPAAQTPLQAPKLPGIVQTVVALVIVGFYVSLFGVVALAAMGKLEGPALYIALFGFGAATFAFATAVAYAVGSSLGSWAKNGNILTHPAAEPVPQPAPIPAQVPIPVPQSPPAPASSAGPFASFPPWFQGALHELGVHEAGNNSGADIRRYIDLAHAGSEGDPWCAIFANAMLEQSGIPGTRSASSQSFRGHANFVQLSGPAPGAIVVFWRGSQSSGLGHVGFYRGENSSSVWTLGGNENDEVEIAALPKSSGSFGLVGYYWPKQDNQGRAVPLPTVGAVNMPSGSPTVVTTDPTGGKAASTSDGWQSSIVATVFGGAADYETSAYTGKVIGDNDFGVALPYRFSGDRPMVVVRSHANPSLQMTVPIVDVGPWNTNDPYWETGSRPQAESGVDRKGRRTNLAGIDLTVATATALRVDGKGKVDWCFAPDSGAAVSATVT